MIPRLVVTLLAVSGVIVAQTPLELASLRYIDTKEGTGAPAAAGKRLTVHYTGYLKDGTKFDSSLDRNEPFQFVQGKRQVITGWDIGFEGMKVGGKRRLIIPYQLAYGEAGSGPIPPKAELTFDVELLGVTDAPAAKPSVDVLVPFEELEARVMALARAVPEEKYGWRPPQTGGGSFGEIFAQIAALNRAVLEGAGKDEPVLKALEKTNPFTSRAELLASLGESFQQVKTQLEAARNGYLSSDAQLFGKSTTTRGLFTALDTLMGEQLGYLEAYARFNKIPFTAIFELNSPINQ